MGSVQLSFALQHHLVQAHLSTFTEEIEHGYGAVSPVERKFGTVGRVSELPVVEELAVQHFVFLGSRLSSHSAVVGPLGVTVPQYFGFGGPALDLYIETGLKREPVQSWVQERLFDLLEDLPMDDPDFNIAKDRLLLAYLSHRELNEMSFRTRGVLGRLVERGVSLLDHPGCDAIGRAIVLNYLGLLAWSELYISLRHGLSSSIPSTSLRTLFPDTSDQPPHLPPITPTDYLLIASDEDEARYAQRRTDIFAPLIKRQNFFLLKLNLNQSSTPVSQIRSAWALYHESLTFLDTAIRRVVGDGQRTPSARESDFIYWILILEINVVYGITLCDDIVHNLVGAEQPALIKESDEMLSHTRVVYANHVNIFMSLERLPPHDEGTRARKITIPLMHSRRASLLSWCRSFSGSAKILLRVVTYAAYGDARAARLAMEMREAIMSVEAPQRIGFTRETSALSGVEEQVSGARLLVDEALADLTLSKGVGSSSSIAYGELYEGEAGTSGTKAIVEAPLVMMDTGEDGEDRGWTEQSI